MSRKRLKHWGILGVGRVVVSCCFILLTYTQQQLETQNETPVPGAAEAPHRGKRQVHPATRPPLNSEFYRTIIDNNLFRPLGWTPPRPQEPYRLMGTILPRSANRPPQAILQATAGNKTHIVTTGDKLDAETKVIDIQPKQVTLSTNGQSRTLHLQIRY